MARKSTGSGTTITCTISGKSRPTTYPYLTDKATRLGVSVADLKKFYICREVITQLNKGANVFDIANPECEESLKALLTENTIEQMIALNSRSKKPQPKAKPIANDTDNDVDIDLTLVDQPIVEVEKVMIEEPLSPETEAYLAQKAELLGGQEVVDEIHAKVWGEEEEEEEVMA